MPAKRKGNELRIRLTILVDPATKAALDHAAWQAKLSMSEYAEKAILEKIEREKDAKP